MLNVQSSWHLPLIFSYMGTLPFIAFTALATGNIHFPLLDDPQIIYFTTLAYAGLILFFMAGADWGKALQTGNVRQYIVAMGFSLAGFSTLIIAMILQHSASWPLAAFAGLFAAFFVAENWAHAGQTLSFRNYIAHRIILTGIVIVSLIISTYLHSKGVSY